MRSSSSSCFGKTLTRPIPQTTTTTTATTSVLAIVDHPWPALTRPIHLLNISHSDQHRRDQSEPIQRCNVRESCENNSSVVDTSYTGHSGHSGHSGQPLCCSARCCCAVRCCCCLLACCPLQAIPGQLSSLLCTPSIVTPPGYSCRRI